MPRLDAFIKTLFAKGGTEIAFASGRGAVMSGPQGPVQLVRQPLSTHQITGAFAEVVPADLAKGFPRPGTTAFDYAAPSGAVDIRFERRGETVQATVVPRSAPAAAEAPGGGPPGAAPGAPAYRDGPQGPRPEPLGQRPEPHPEPVAAAAGPPLALPEDAGEAMAALLERMQERRASDLHLSSGSPPALRVDGDIAAIAGSGPIGPDRLREMLWSIAPERNRAEWEARRDTDFAHERPGARFRVNVFSDRRGIGAVLRQIPTGLLTAEEMGLPQHVLDLCFLHKGLVLVTGPTGSGKSTTLAALVDYVNRHREDHIITIEDPIEFVHDNKRCLVNQREVGNHTDSFKSALRAALREDPDVVLVGELRDLETIAIAIETAETGHLVFGTLHTNTAPSTVDRIIDQFPADRQAQIRTMLSESLRGVVAQTLCKRIGGGRAAALEVLLVSPSVSNLIREGKTFQIPSVMQTGRGQGMVTLNDALLDLVKRKVVEPREALARAAAKGELRQQLERAGFSLEAPAA
jgi:twitching motility protein PilT